MNYYFLFTFCPPCLVRLSTFCKPHKFGLSFSVRFLCIITNRRTTPVFIRQNLTTMNQMYHLNANRAGVFFDRPVPTVR